MDGEKELVLGNRQLVGFFFVVVALCGVFFALGYMIRGNSGKMTVPGVDGATAATTSALRTQESEPPRETTEVRMPPGGSTVDAAPTVTDTAPESDPKPLRTQPAHDSPEPAATPGPAGDSQLTVPEAGATYLQVGALHRSDAETMARSLREQGYPVVLATSSKADFFRVLVGPYHQTAQVADTKARLKTLGFADAFVLRQTP